jgi:hypothetical protein
MKAIPRKNPKCSDGVIRKIRYMRCVIKEERSIIWKLNEIFILHPHRLNTYRLTILGKCFEVFKNRTYELIEAHFYQFLEICTEMGIEHPNYNLVYGNYYDIYKHKTMSPEKCLDKRFMKRQKALRESEKYYKSVLEKSNETGTAGYTKHNFTTGHLLANHNYSIIG